MFRKFSVYNQGIGLPIVHGAAVGNLVMHGQAKRLKSLWRKS